MKTHNDIAKFHLLVDSFTKHDRIMLAKKIEHINQDDEVHQHVLLKFFLPRTINVFIIEFIQPKNYWMIAVTREQWNDQQRSGQFEAN